MCTRNTSKVPARGTRELRELHYWKDTAAKRFRLCWATGVLGGVAGFVFHWVISVPPVWM